jgi:hypothetical protein
VGRSPQELMRDGVCKHSSVRLSDLTADWEFGSHATLLKEARREGGVGRGKNTPAKSAEMRSESQGFKEVWRNEAFWTQEMAEKVMIQDDKRS